MAEQHDKRKSSMEYSSIKRGKNQNNNKKWKVSTLAHNRFPSDPKCPNMEKRREKACKQNKEKKKKYTQNSYAKRQNKRCNENHDNTKQLTLCERSKCRVETATATWEIIEKMSPLYYLIEFDGIKCFYTCYDLDKTNVGRTRFVRVCEWASQYNDVSVNRLNASTLATSWLDWWENPVKLRWACHPFGFFLAFECGHILLEYGMKMLLPRIQIVQQMTAEWIDVHECACVCVRYNAKREEKKDF